MMNYFYETIGRMKSLQQIKNIAWHVIEDRDRVEYNRTTVRVEDIAGKTLEIVIHDRCLHLEMYNQDCVLVTLLLMRLYDDNHIAANPWLIDVYMDLDKEVNKARRVLPYTGINLLNEREVYLYDHVNPEWIF